MKGYKLLFSVFLVIFLVSTSVDVVSGHGHGAYSRGESDFGDGLRNWQSNLRDYDTIDDISLPGTHDSIAYDNDGDYVDAQELTLENQLRAGIRALDIRCRVIGGSFAIHHGAYYLSKNFGDVLNAVTDFLTANPSEFIIMRIKQEYSEVYSGTFGDIFNNVYYTDNRWTSYFYKFEEGNDPSTFIPTVSDVRGKIVLFMETYDTSLDKRFGFSFRDGNIRDIQDAYEVPTISDLYGKWEKVRSQLDNANNNKDNGHKFYINFFSGSSNTFPYFVASGHSSPGTNAPRLSTGLTTPGFANTWPDFPRTNCFIGICTISYEGTNILGFDYMHGLNFVGIIFIDFPGYDLIKRITEKNIFHVKINNLLNVLSLPLNWEGSVALKSWHGKWTAAESNNKLVANRYEVHAWEKFRLRVVSVNPHVVTLKTSWNKYCSAQPNGHLNCDRTNIGGWEKFEVIASDLINGGIFFKSIDHNKYIVAENGNGDVNVDRTNPGIWETWQIDLL